LITELAGRLPGGWQHILVPTRKWGLSVDRISDARMRAHHYWMPHKSENSLKGLIGLSGQTRTPLFAVVSLSSKFIRIPLFGLARSISEKASGSLSEKEISF